MTKLHDIHAFGRPICALEKKTADRKKTPRWRRRSDRAMCVGRSERHAGSAPLVLNFNTGNITAQWNVAFNDWFSTVATNADDMLDSHVEEWADMLGTSACEAKDDEESHKVVTQPTNRND